MPSEIVKIPFQGDYVFTTEVDGEPHVILRPAFNSIGVKADEQIERVKRQAWGTTRVTRVVAADGKQRQVITAPVKTFLMALATISASRVREEIRPRLEAYQCEVADVIDAHWKGKATPSPLSEIEVARRYLAAVEEKERMKAIISEKEEVISVLEPKAQEREEFIGSTDQAYDLATVAKALGMKAPDGRPVGRNILKDILRELKVITKIQGQDQIYQSYANREWFDVRFEWASNNRWQGNVIYVWPKGVSGIYNLLLKEGYGIRFPHSLLDGTPHGRNR